MLAWLMDVATMMIGVLCVVAFLYGLVVQTRDKPQRQYLRLDRRESERTDRRHEDLGPPQGFERRVGPRRWGEAH